MVCSSLSTALYCPEGSSSNAQCPAGFYCLTPTARVQCGSGRYCPSGSAQEGPCPAGSVCNTPSTIQQCAPGSFCPQNSSMETPCGSGSYCPRGSTQESPCPAGSVCSNPSTLRQCVLGSYCPSSSSVESRCSIGYFCPNQTVQIQCPVGYFCDSGSTAPSALNDDGCAPPALYLPFTSSLTDNLGYRVGSNISVFGTCAIAQRICYLVEPCRSGLWSNGQTSSYIEFPVHVNAAFSLAMWVYPEMLTNSLFSLYNGAGDSVFHVSMSPDSTISVNLFLKTLPVSMRSFFIFNERTWMHVAVSIEYSSGNYTGRVFLNGIETARLVTPGAAVLNNNHVARIGSIKDYVNGFYGGISQFGFLNYALSTQQVFSIFKGNLTSCKCPAGFYCVSTELLPIPCPSGTYSSLAGQTSSSACHQCPVGYFCVSGSNSPAQCSLGYSCPEGSASHLPCPSGFYCSSPSLKVICSTGSFCPPRSIADIPCPVGSYCPNASTKVQCETTNYCPANSTVESKCPAGSFCPTPFSIQLCSSSSSGGTFCPQGSTSEAPCPAGSVCATSVSKVICPANGFCAAGSSAAVLCPSPSVSPPGSVDFTNCSCPIGTYGRVLSSSVASCNACMQGGYCTGDAIQCLC